MSVNGTAVPDLGELAETARKLTDHYAAAIRTALAHSSSLSMAMGADEAVAQEAIERALMITAVGTFQARLMRMSGKPASCMDACLGMAAMIDNPHAKPGDAEPGPNILGPVN